jgi:hypothetical protein
MLLYLILITRYFRRILKCSSILVILLTYYGSKEYFGTLKLYLRNILLPLKNDLLHEKCTLVGILLMHYSIFHHILEFLKPCTIFIT